MNKLGSIVTLAIGLLVLSPAAQGATPDLSVPDEVRPGFKVALKASGYSSGVQLSLTLTCHVNRGCARSTSLSGGAFWSNPLRRTANDEGEATFRFRWPRRYLSCDSRCRRPEFRRGGFAQINLSTPQMYINKYVRIGKARARPPGPKTRTIPVVGNKARVQYPCTVNYTCKGKITFKQGKKTLAAGRYSVRSGRTGKLKIPLTKAGRAALERNRSIRASLTVNPDRNGKSVTVPVILSRGR